MPPPRTTEVPLSDLPVLRDNSILFGLLFGTVGLAAVVAFFGLPLWRVAMARSWIATPCTILESRVETHADSDGDTYRLVIRYVYRASAPTEVKPAVERIGDRYSFTPGSKYGYGPKARAATENPSGSRRTCWVDPADPTNSVLVREATRELWPATFLLLLPLMGYGFSFVAWRGMRRRAQRVTTINVASGSTSCPAILGGAVRAAGADDAKLRQTGLPRLAKVALFTAFCLFWNSLFGFFLFEALTPTPQWGLIAILIPFELVGLALIYEVVHAFLGLTNPVPELSGAGGPLRLGTTVRLTWRFRGSTHRLTALRLGLIVREEASYERGTTTVTDRQVLLERELAASDQPLAMAEGTCDLAMPGGLPPTIDGDHNHIRWLVTVRGTIPWWPDVSAEFPLTVIHDRPLRLVPAATSDPAEEGHPAEVGAWSRTVAVEGGHLRLTGHTGRDGRLTGQAEWELVAPAAPLELRLFWYTSGRGTRDVGVVANEPFAEAQAVDRRTFAFAAPSGPPPCDGTLIAIRWALELVAGDRVLRVELVSEDRAADDSDRRSATTDP